MPFPASLTITLFPGRRALTHNPNVFLSLVQGDVGTAQERRAGPVPSTQSYESRLLKGNYSYEAGDSFHQLPFLSTMST